MSAADDPDGNKLNPMPRRQENHQHLGFDFETFRAQRQSRPRFQMDETKTALRVGQVPARAARQLAAHPAVHLPAQPGNGFRVVHAVAHHQQCPGLFGASPKGRQILGRVLAIAIQHHSPFETLLPRPRQSGFERSPFAEISPVSNDLCACPAGQA